MRVHLIRIDVGSDWLVRDVLKLLEQLCIVLGSFNDLILVGFIKVRVADESSWGVVVEELLMIGTVAQRPP